MLDISLPKRTASECELPNSNGKKVWVQTLNDIHRKRVYQASETAARIAVKGLRKGGPEHESLLAEINENDKETQCRYIAQSKIANGDFWIATEEAFKHPNPPDREKFDTEQDYQAAIDKHEDLLQELDEKRNAKIQELYDEDIEKSKTLSNRERIKACIEIAIKRKFNDTMLDTYNLYTLLYAVRELDDHFEFYYSSINRVEDEDDEIRDALISKYRELDSISQMEVPT